MKPTRILTYIALLFLVIIGYVGYKMVIRKKSEEENNSATTASAKKNRNIKIIKA